MITLTSAAEEALAAIERAIVHMHKHHWGEPPLDSKFFAYTDLRSARSALAAALAPQKQAKDN